MRFMRAVIATGVIATGSLVSMTGAALAQTQGSQTQPVSAGRLGPEANRPAQPRMLAQSQFQISEGIIATVNDRIITGYDLLQRIMLLLVMSEIQPTEENIEQIQREALNMLIEDHLKAQEIARFPTLVIPDEEVNAQITIMAEEVGLTYEQYLAAMQEAGIHPRTLREHLRIAIAWGELVRGRFGTRARPSPNQVDQAIRQYEQAATKKQYLIGEIYIEAAQVGGMQAAVDGAQQLIRQMVQGAPFQAVAQQFSDSPSAARGGDAGWVVEGTVQPALQQAFDNLDVGQLSNPIVVEGGVYIVYMRDKRDGSASSLVQLRHVMVELAPDAPESAVEAAAQRLFSIRPELSCDTMLARASSEAGLMGSDLGESEVLNLAPQFQPFARDAQVGQLSDPIRTPLGLHLIAVCGRRVGTAEMPSTREIEGRLQRQNLAMLERRYIRDLRADALIEFKQ